MRPDYFFEMVPCRKITTSVYAVGKYNANNHADGMVISGCASEFVDSETGCHK